MPRFKGYAKTKRSLAASARKRGFKKGSRRYGAYVYGTLGRVAKKVKRKR
jgi:hypothetical protein